MSNKTMRAAALNLLLAMMIRAGLVYAQGPTQGSADAPRDKSTVARRPSAKAVRKAEDAYLRGATEFEHKQFEAAQRLFQRAAELNPEEKNYALSVSLAREARVTVLVRQAEEAKFHKDRDRADDLLRKAQAVDPNDPDVSQHFEAASSATPVAHRSKVSLQGPIDFMPSAGKQSFHLRGDLRSAISRVYAAFGISVTFDPSVPTGKALIFDVDDVDFAQATRILARMSGTFSVPLQPRDALIAVDSQDRRAALAPLVEATIYLPGESQEQLLDLANLARSVFGLKQVTVSAVNRALMLRGEERAVLLASETFADMLDSQPDVLLDVNVYVVDRSRIQNIGLQPPSTATAIDVSNAAQKLISNNQTLLNESIAAGALTLSGSTYAQELEEVEYLVAAGVSGSSEFTGIIGTLGSDQGIPIAGISIGSAALNLLLSVHESKRLDALQIRATTGEAATFRVGSRYPILTSVSKASTTNSALVSELEAAGISSATIAQYAGSSGTTTVPQIQYEDLGITLKVTPQVVDESDVRLKLDFRIEALDGTGVDNIPVLDNYSLVSVVQVPAGKAAILATLITTNETKALDGVPELNDLPGFQSTNSSTDGTRNQLLLTVTPHIVSGIGDGRDCGGHAPAPRCNSISRALDLPRTNP